MFLLFHLSMNAFNVNFAICATIEHNCLTSAVNICIMALNIYIASDKHMY